MTRAKYQKAKMEVKFIISIGKNSTIKGSSRVWFRANSLHYANWSFLTYIQIVVSISHSWKKETIRC